MNDIYILTDYKGQFGSKSDSEFYRSGMNIKLLGDLFREKGFNTHVLSLSDVDFRTTNWQGRIVIYTSQEDPDYVYKNYIEDIVYALELAGATVIPRFKYLRSNNNKVFMELLRDITASDVIKNIRSHHFGTLEDLIRKLDANEVDSAQVIKSAQGAMSQGVFLGKNKSELIEHAKKISKVPGLMDNLRDMARAYKHKGYKKISMYRKKFVTQNLIPNLKNDWKILVFGDRFYLEYRGIRDNDFRASGSQRFKLNDDIPVATPDGIFEFAEKVRNALNTPHLSIDIGYDTKTFYLFEFQALYFSSYAHRKSERYYQKVNNVFTRIDEMLPLEKVYVDGVCGFIAKSFSYNN